MATTNRKFICFNFNPWGKIAPDCSIRAISAATGLDYREICKKFGFSYKNGYGMIRQSGVNLTDIKHVFNEYFDIVEDFYDNYNFVPDEYKDSIEASQMDFIDSTLDVNAVTGITLNEFIDMFRNRGTFLVSVTGNPKAKNPNARTGGHIVCANCSPINKKQGFIDIWDSGEMLVDAYMRIKKVEPMNSPKHWRYDREKHRFIV